MGKLTPTVTARTDRLGDMGIRSDGDIASAELVVAAADGREFLDAARRGEAARVDLDDGVRLDERTQDGIDVVGEVAIADFRVVERGTACDVVDVCKCVDLGLGIDLCAHRGEILVVHLMLFPSRISLGQVEISALQ